jgi:hypothetical protein
MSARRVVAMPAIIGDAHGGRKGIIDTHNDERHNDYHRYYTGQCR